VKRLFPFFLLIVVSDLSASQICSSTSTYSPIAGVTHQTAVLTDPAGEQTAMFDLAWGGALVSLKYHNVEYISSASTLAGIQPILRATNYTAVLAGDDEDRGSPMLGVACSDRELWLTAGTTDYSRNQGASTAYVHNNSQWYFDHFSAPYVVSTYAYFVPNPFGSPAYYLRLDQSISNIDGQESVAFTLDLSAAPVASYGFFRSLPAACSGPSSSCTASTAYMIGGYYNAAGTDGLAIATTPSAQWTAEVGTVSVEGDSGSAGNIIHLKKSGWHVAPRTGRTHSSVVMVGNWATAAAYAGRACTFAVSLPFLVASSLYSAAEGGDSALNGTIAAAGASTVVSVTAPPGCSWDASVATGSAPNYLSITPSSGSGNGTITLNIATNPTSAIRIGNVFIAGQLFPFWQQIGCLYSLDATSASVPAEGGNGSVTVTAPTGSCSWRATTDASWIAITSGSSGSGNGTVNYSVATNAGGARTATIVVAGLIYTVSQAAASNCTFYSLTPSSAGPNYQNGFVSATVTGSPAGCIGSWTATGNGSWITVSPQNGSGSGPVTVSWAQNPSTSPRSSSATIGGTTFTVSQGAAPAVVSGFYVLTPCRLIDTRDPNGSYGGPSLAATTPRNIMVAGQCGIPAGVTSLSVNVAVVGPAAGGFLTLYPGPTANPRPIVSTINFSAGQVIANNGIVGVAADGSINVYNGNTSPTNFIIDVNGYFK
jgi:hypothetical protein